MHLPYSGQRVAVDGILIPNGTILPNEQGGVFDFWSSPKKLGANLTSPDLVGGCGSGCVGYDTCWLVNREQNGPYDWRVSGPVATVSSPFSGIQIDIFSEPSWVHADPTRMEQIIFGFLNDWHPEKRDKFRAIDLTEWLGWMRRHGIVPTGSGPKTETGRLFV